MERQEKFSSFEEMEAYVEAEEALKPPRTPEEQAIIEARHARFAEAMKYIKENGKIIKHSDE